MAGPQQSQAKPFWSELERYLRSFHADLSTSVAPGGFPEGGSWWFRQVEGSLHFTGDEWRSYQRLLQDAYRRFSRDTDLSRAAIDSALKDAIFAVADIRGNRDREAEVRIRGAVDEVRAFIEGPGDEYECWVEVEGLEEASLPAKFGTTHFAVVGDEHVDHLESIIRDKHVAGRARKIEGIGQFIGDSRGRTVAAQRVKARDRKAALLVAVREMSVTLESLNFFADVIPYNHARLRIADGGSGRGSSLRVAIADGGSFLLSPKGRVPWGFSLEGLRELAGVPREALRRVEALRCKDDRSEVEELLLRAVRWVGRAVAAERLEDGFLFSWIALDCITRPEEGTSIGSTVALRSAHVLRGQNGVQDGLRRQIWRLYRVRCDLVHDGSLEVVEDDRAAIQAIALDTVVWALISPDVEGAATLDELEAFFVRVLAGEPT